MGGFASRITEGRKGRLTVRELAALVDVSPAYISKIEVRGEIPAGVTICRIADALGIDPQELLQLAESDRLQKAKAEISKKHDEALLLYRRSK